ncbi:MAG: fluoride efflux transporter CrcB [Planctomycetales bacterium]|nr:fluoride efflux transporter CrcB [Planctomycetales bacterium]
MLPSIKQILLVAMGGALGASGRLVVTRLATHVWGERFPWGTLIVNVVGCFALGLLLRLGPQSVSDSTKLLVGVGLLGGLTTFSTFGMDTVSRWEQGEWMLGLVNVAANLLIGLLAVAAGIWMGQVFAAKG